MKKILDGIVAGFFIIVLGAVWYFSTKYYVKPKQYSVIIYDLLGEQVKTDQIRTDFKTQAAAQNHIFEYQKRFPHLEFSIATELPEFKRKAIFRIFKKTKDNEFSYEH